MNYEKAYKDALESAKGIINYYKEHNRGDESAIEDLEIIFPELKESEDERIRRNIIAALRGEGYYDCDLTNECIAWLEKQGEQKVPINDFKAKNWYVSEVDGKIHDMTYNPAEKVEPKFKVGDWVVNNNSGDIFQVTEIKDDEYCLWPLYGEICGYLRIIDVDTDHHLWTIQDAKDGDVLIDKSHVGEYVFIFKEARPSDIKTDVNNPLAVIGYCGINHIGFTSQLSGLGFGNTVNCTYYPATKEQRELLFKKMKESGYEWNPDTKKLKKVEKKPTWSEEDETLLYEIVDYFNMDDALRHTENEIIDWLKSLKERLL